MNAAHLHLVLNHIPVVGVPLSLLILLYGFWAKKEEAVHAAKLLFIGIALLTFPVFFSGEPAEDVIRNLPGFEKGYVHPHEEAGEVAFVLTSILGGVSLLSVLLSKKELIRRYSPIVIALLALATTITLGWTANLGGQIRHPEIRASK